MKFTENFHLKLKSRFIFRTEFIKNSEINFVKFSNTTLIANVPYDFKKLFFGESIVEIPSLQELCMRSIKSKFESFSVPIHLAEIMMYPTSICQCQNNVYSEAHALFYLE